MSSDAFVLELARRISELETRVAQLEGGAAAGPPPGYPTPGPESDPGVREAIASGNLISAIKRYRELTGMGLAEAKDAVEKLQRGY